MVELWFFDLDKPCFQLNYDLLDTNTPITKIVYRDKVFDKAFIIHWEYNSNLFHFEDFAIFENPVNLINISDLICPQI